jgi:hypothetical protein
MIAALIFVVSLAALMQFFVSYTRSLVASSRKVSLSEQVREVTGIDGGLVHGDEFGRLLQLVELCPEPGDDRLGIRAVRAYFSLLNIVRGVVSSFSPSTASWVENERESCAYFAAVSLDHRIAFNRELMARQAANRF